MVIEASPDTNGLGEMVTVRLAPLPAKVMLSPETRPGLEELPLSERSDSGVSISAMEKESGPAGWPILVVIFSIGEIVGGSSTGLTVMLADSAAEL